jgi:hypothetical protein
MPRYISINGKTYSIWVGSNKLATHNIPDSVLASIGTAMITTFNNELMVEYGYSTRY